MSLTVHAMRGGENEYQETADGMSLLWYLMFSQGVPLRGTVVDSSPDTGYFAVQAQSTPNKTVKVKAGYMLVKATPTSETERMFIANLSADSNVTIADNTSGSPKYDKVYLYLPADALHDPEESGDLTEAACLLTERHDAANEALTATNAIELAEITVANGFTEIADAVIADRRVFSSLLPKGDWQNMVGAVTCGANNVLTISGTDYVSSVAVGDKIWVKDDGTDWMGYVIAKDATTATVIGGTTAGAAATIASGSKITNARFSKGNAVGFPHAFATAIGYVRFEGGTMIQYGSLAITCVSGSDNAAGTINFPAGLNFADTNYTFTHSGVNSTNFASVNETPFACHSTHTAAQAVVTLFARSGTWAANRNTTVKWRAEGKI